MTRKVWAPIDRVRQVEQPLDFRFWLREHRGQDTPLGDFADDAWSGRQKFQRHVCRCCDKFQTRESTIEHMRREHQACGAAIAVAEEVWDAYEAYRIGGAR